MKIKRFISLLITITLLFSLLGCSEISDKEVGDILNNLETTINEAAETVQSENNNADKDEQLHVRIVSTSDIHGKMLAYDYALDQPDASGSIAQISSALKEYRDDDTILVDLGDNIQDNLADIFLDEEVHPMQQAINAIGYDICTIGNHEFNFGMDNAIKYMNNFTGDFLVGNIYDENGESLANGYKTIEKNGVKIAFIGMITPNITKWDKNNLQNYTVTDPAEETNKIIDEIENQVDIIVGVYHMMESDEYDVEHSGFTSMASACPRLNLILAAHGHSLVNKTLTNNIPVTENLNSGKTIQVVDINVSSTDHSIKQINTTSVETKDYPEDPDLVKLLSPYDSRAKEYARTKIGLLKDGPLTPTGEISGISSYLIQDTPLQSLLQEVLMYYATADVAFTAPCSNEDNAQPGDLTIASICNMYKYSNTLYSIKMNGSQLKKYLEWSASFYKQYHDGDLTIAFEDTPVYMYDSASGINYDIDISKPVGERIVNLSYPNGKIITDEDNFTVAVTNYRYNSALSIPGIIFDEGEIPELIATDIRSDIGDTRFMIIDYIKNVKGGEISPECDNNWKIIGNDWDEDLHKKAVEQINNGTLKLTEGAKGNPNIATITVDDLK